jgi:hypothetical protein
MHIFRRHAAFAAAFAVAGVLTAASATIAIAATGPVTVSEASPPGIWVNEVSCSSVGNCTATATDQSGYPWLLTEASGTWATAVQPTMPANVARPSLSETYPVSCSAPGNCVVVGTYGDSAGHLHGLLLAETAGTWAPGIEAPLPADAAGAAYPGLGLDLTAVSCPKSPAAAGCAAVGKYTDNSGNVQGLLLTLSAGQWTAAEAALPANAAGNPEAQLKSVSCPSVGNCTAVGSYDSPDAFGGAPTVNLILTETAGTWAGGVSAPVIPGGPLSADPDVPKSFDQIGVPTSALTSVSCTSAGNCTAVGSQSIATGLFDSDWIAYNDPLTGLPTYPNGQGLILTETGGTWVGDGQYAAMPGGANATIHSDPHVQLTGLSCGSAGNCAAIGSYIGGPVPLPVLLTETDGTWGTGVAPPVPANATGTEDPLSVSCGSATSCTGAGQYLAGDASLGSLLTETSGSWAPPVEVDPPANAYSPSDAALFALSCPSVSYCAAVGFYYDAAATPDGLLASQASPPGLSLTDTAPAAAARRRPYSYRLTAVSTGGQPASGVTVTDTMPAGARISSVTASGGRCTTTGSAKSGGGTVTCTADSLYPGASITVTITVTVKAVGTVRDAASVAAGNVTGTQTASAVTIVRKK